MMKDATAELLMLAIQFAQVTILAGILYVLWWDANHGIYPIGGGGI